jgi:hypothetical protein
MISSQEWDSYPDKKKLDYLFDHSIRTERAVDRLAAAIEALRLQVAKLQLPPADAAS